MTPTRDELIKKIMGRRYTQITYLVPRRPKCCAERIEWDDTQCSDQPGHGLGGLFCKQHAKNNPEVE